MCTHTHTHTRTHTHTYTRAHAYTATQESYCACVNEFTHSSCGYCYLAFLYTYVPMVFYLSTHCRLHTLDTVLCLCLCSSLSTNAAEMGTRTTTVPPSWGVCAFLCQSTKRRQVWVDLQWSIRWFCLDLQFSSGSQYMRSLQVFGAQQTQHRCDSSHSHLHERWADWLFCHRVHVWNQVQCGYYPQTIHCYWLVWLTIKCVQQYSVLQLYMLSFNKGSRFCSKGASLYIKYGPSEMHPYCTDYVLKRYWSWTDVIAVGRK